MIITSGRNSPDIKVQTSLAGTPYTNLFAISAKATTDSKVWKLATTVPELKALPHKQLTSLTKPYIASTSAQDSSTGTGLRVIQVVGLDENYQLQDELVVLNGQTPVQLAKNYMRVFEITGVVYGTNIDTTGDAKSVGDIYVGTGNFISGIPANPITAILASDNDPNSRVGIFTTWDGCVSVVKSLTCTVTADNTDDNSMYVMLALRFFGMGSNNWYKTTPFFFIGSFQYIPEYYLPLPPKTDIQIRVQNGTTKEKSCSIELVLQAQDLR